jgi:hypothetical protein
VPSDPAFTILFKTGAIYTNSDTSKWSIRKLDDSWVTYEEGVKSKYPGYDYDEKYTLKNIDDLTINFEELREFLLSKDLD